MTLLSQSVADAALARWEALGWPSTRLESWRNFSTRALHGLDLAGGIAPSSEADSEAKVAACVSLFPGPRVVFVDGRFAPRWTVLGELAEVFSLRALSSIGEARAVDAVVVSADEFGADEGLQALNAALVGDGLDLRISATFGLAVVLQVVHITTGTGVAHLRHAITLEANASATIGMHHFGLGDRASFVNVVTTLELKSGASLRLAKRVEEGAAGSHIEAVIAHVGADASLQTFTLSLAGERVRTAVTVYLEGRGAQADVDGLYLGRGQDKLDHVTDMRHVVGDTRSSETWSGVLDDRSEGGFQGVVRIAANAVRSATRQLTRTLLLSPEAEAHARPELHIDCDDVTASHGATIGQIDLTEQFYLESRGLPPEEARRMLVMAFVVRALELAPALLRVGLGGLDAAVAKVYGSSSSAGPESLEAEDVGGL